MNNLVQEKADVITLTAPTGGVVVGLAYLIGGIFGVAIVTAAAGVAFALRVRGVVEIVKKAGEAWAEGDALYWDDANSQVTISPEGTVFIGQATEVTASAATTGKVRLVAANISGAGSGKVGVSLTAPTGGVVAGTAYLIGNVLALALETKAATESFVAQITGIITHAKATGAISEGDRIYWDDANSVLTTEPTGNYFVGVAVQDQLSGDANATINLLGVIQDEMAGVFSLTAPTGGVTKGTPVLISTVLTVPCETIAATNPYRAKVGGPAKLSILGTDVISEGDAMYWDDGNSRLTSTASTHTLVGWALEDKASGVDTISIMLGGYCGTLTN